MVWELVFMMLVLKIPIFYLCGVVWWAIRAEPRPLEGAQVAVPVEPNGGPDLCDYHRRRRPRPSPRPRRGYARSPRSGLARAEARR